METRKCECDKCLEGRAAGQRAIAASKKRNRTTASLRLTVWSDKEDIFPSKIIVSKEHFNNVIEGLV